METISEPALTPELIRDRWNRLQLRLRAAAEAAGRDTEGFRIVAVTKGIRSFTTTPYVFTSTERARSYVGTAANKASYFLLRLAPGADVENVRGRLRAALPDAEVLTPAEFSERSRSFWRLRSATTAFSCLDFCQVE